MQFSILACHHSKSYWIAISLHNALKPSIWGFYFVDLHFGIKLKCYFLRSWSVTVLQWCIISWYHAGAALAPKMLVPEKSPGIKFCRQFQKVGARKFRCHNLFIQNRSLSSMQILSLMTPALKSWYCCSITGYTSKG